MGGTAISLERQSDLTCPRQNYSGIDLDLDQIYLSHMSATVHKARHPLPPVTRLFKQKNSQIFLHCIKTVTLIFHRVNQRGY